MVLNLGVGVAEESEVNLACLDAVCQYVVDITQEEIGLVQKVEPFLQVVVYKRYSEKPLRVIFIRSQNSVRFFFHCKLIDIQSWRHKDPSLPH